MRDQNGFSLLELLIVVAIILIIATISIPSLLRSRQAANESAAVATMKTINTAQIAYSGAGGNYGTLAGLVAAGLLDESFNSTTSRPKAGYIYRVTANGGDYTAEAVPASSNSGRYGYYSTPDAVVRYSTSVSLVPDPALIGRSVQ